MSDGRDLLQRIASAGARLDPGLSDRDVDRLVEGARNRGRRRRLRRVGLAGLAVGAGLLVLATVAHRSPDLSKQVVVATGPGAVAPLPVADRSVRLLDGSTATPLDTGSEIAIVEQSADRVGLSLARGRGRFEVAPRAQRVFSVRAGEVTVTVVGTVFTVERIADRVGVDVARGTVRVAWGTGSRLLQKGESGWFPPLASASSEPGAVRSARGKTVKARSQVAGLDAEREIPVPAMGQTAALNPPRPATQGEVGERSETGEGPPLSWPKEAGLPSGGAALQPPRPATRGEVGERSETGEGPRVPWPKAQGLPSGGAEGLLVEADGARLAGQPERGAELLKRLLRDHRADPRAPLAAFTLGRVLLMELGRPREAAGAFAQVRQLAPNGSFAEDALAREVEAWSRAGQPDTASARAREYLRLYPGGRRAASVRASVQSVGGLE